MLNIDGGLTELLRYWNWVSIDQDRAMKARFCEMLPKRRAGINRHTKTMQDIFISYFLQWSVSRGLKKHPEFNQ